MNEEDAPELTEADLERGFLDQLLLTHYSLMLIEL